MSGDYFVGHEVLAKAVEESRAREQENLQALLRVARAAEAYTDYFGPFGLNSEEQEIWDNLYDALKELPEGLLEVVK